MSEMRRALYSGFILIVLMVLSAVPPLAAYPVETSSAGIPSLGEEALILVRGQALRGLRSDRIIVGTWTSIGWVELPFITLPLRNNTFTMGFDILYHGKPLRKLDAGTARICDKSS